MQERSQSQRKEKQEKRKAKGFLSKLRNKVSAFAALTLFLIPFTLKSFSAQLMY